jgi:hypothetical protein
LIFSIHECLWLAKTIKVVAVAVVSAMLLPACGKSPTLASSDVVRARALSGHSTPVTAYKLPRGHYRCVFPPSDSNPYFNIEFIVNGKEEDDLRIPAPAEFYKVKDCTEDWTFEINEGPEKRISCLASRTDEDTSIRIELPGRNRRYEFWANRNSAGKELLIFVDYSDNVDGGLFGYVLIEKIP